MRSFLFLGQAGDVGFVRFETKIFISHGSNPLLAEGNNNNSNSRYIDYIVLFPFLAHHLRPDIYLGTKHLELHQDRR